MVTIVDSHPEVPVLDWAVASRTLPGQNVSGDLHLIQPCEHGVLVAVVDGVGHGDEATLAARTAVNALAESPTEPVVSLVKHCHPLLAKTRGVVMTLAWIDSREATVTWLGVGNVQGLLLRADTRTRPVVERVLLRGGLVGYQLPVLQASVLPINPGDLLVFASDGIQGDFSERLTYTAQAPQRIADQILSRSAKETDDALVLVGRFRGGQP